MLKSMNAMDAGMLAMESPETPMHVGGVQILRMPAGAGRDFVSDLREELLHVPVSPPFNYRYKSSGRLPGVPAWEVVKNFDRAEHVFHHGLPRPGTEKQLFDLVAKLDSGPLDRSRPLWEHHLIEGLEGRRYATFSRVHHALIDGKWGIRLLAATTSVDKDARGLLPFWAVRVEDETRSGAYKRRTQAKPGLWKRGRAGLRGGVEAMGGLSAAFLRMAEAFVLPTEGGLTPLYRAPGSIFNGKLTPNRALAVVPVDLQRVQRLAKDHDAKLNDVVMAVCSGGIRRYLAERDALPEQSLIASMMIAVARTEGSSGGNAIVPGMVSLATHLADPVQRFETVRSSSRHAKDFVRQLPSPAALYTYLGLSSLPFALLHLFGRADMAHVFNVVISNVPGLRDKRYINGALIESDYPMSLLVPGEALNITAISRAKTLDFAVLVCPDLAPDPQRLGEAIVESLYELERALARTSRPTAAGRAPARTRRAPSKRAGARRR